MEYIFDEIENCECIGNFDDEYVYDIEMEDETHTFIANDILVHNSLYISYETLIKTINGYEKMSTEQIRDVIVGFNTGFLDEHNKKFMEEYYASRHGKSVQNFELETLSLSGIWLNVKKRYAQLLLWKDGKKFDLDHLKMKNIGLEMAKTSFPKMSRNILKNVVTYLLMNGQDKYIFQKLTLKLNEEKKKWYSADIDEICPNIRVNNYLKYIESDTETGLKVKLKCPSNVKGLGMYNHLINKLHLPDEKIYMGKLKLYEYKTGSEYDYFAYPATMYPEWAAKYVPVDRNRMFQKYVLDPLNRIIEPAGFPAINIDGSVQISLF